MRQAPMSLTTLGRIAAVSMLALVCACTMRRIDDTLLTYAPPDERMKVRTARLAHAKAEGDLARRVSERKSASDRVGIAKADLEVANAELGKSEVWTRVVEMNGSKLEKEFARTVLVEAGMKVHVAHLAIEFREHELDVAELRESIAREKVELRDAEIELAKARAARLADRPEAQTVSLTTFELQVKRHEKAVARAEKREAEATELLITARHKYEAARLDLEGASAKTADKSGSGE